MNVNDLPPYLYCSDEDCTEKHFLSFNRDVQGKWSVGYVEYANHGGIYAENGFGTIQEAVEALREELASKGDE